MNYLGKGMLENYVELSKLFNWKGENHLCKTQEKYEVINSYTTKQKKVNGQELLKGNVQVSCSVQGAMHMKTGIKTNKTKNMYKNYIVSPIHVPVKYWSRLVLKVSRA